jgi:hypothetical protein
MKYYRQVGLKEGKIFIRGEYGNLVSRGYGADEQGPDGQTPLYA